MEMRSGLDEAIQSARNDQDGEEEGPVYGHIGLGRVVVRTSCMRMSAVQNWRMHAR